MISPVFGTSDAAIGARASSSPYPPPTSQYKKQGHFGPCPEGAHQDGQGTEAYVAQGDTEET